jgi:mannose/fructose/N-acetylgalactosamine-specific phosphotransferase system component IIC
MLSETAIAAALGTLICLDRVVAQIMISRPVVAAPLIGFALGDPFAGLVTGALLELLWVDRIPVGPYVPPNDTFVAILATAGAILASPALGHPPRELIALSILLFAPAGFLGQKMEILLRKWNDGLVLQAQEDAKAGDAAGIARRHLVALGRYVAGSLVFLSVALTCGVWLLRGIYPELPGTFLRTLAFAYYVLPFIGIGVALNTIKLRGYVPVFCGVFLLLAIVSEFL